MAAQRNNVGMMRYLLQEGATVNATDAVQSTMLILCHIQSSMLRIGHTAAQILGNLKAGKLDFKVLLAS